VRGEYVHQELISNVRLDVDWLNTRDRDVDCFSCDGAACWASALLDVVSQNLKTPQKV
jgi:hypothetical protein